MALFRRDPLKAAEADVASLSARLDSLRVRMGKAQGLAETAIAEQRRLLIETDGADAAALRKSGDAARKAQDDVAAYQEAERELVRLVGEAQARTAAERDRIERERVAAERAKQVDRIEAAVAKVDAAARALAAAHGEMRTAAFAGIDPDPIAGPGSFIGQVSALVLHVMDPLTYSPPLASLDVTTGRHNVNSPIEAAAPMLAALRARADEVRTGTRAAELPAQYEPAPQAVTVPEEVVWFIRPVSFTAGDGQNIVVQPGGWTVPTPVAARAVELKVGFRPGTREGATIARLLTAEPSRSIERVEETGEIRVIPQHRDGVALNPAREPIDLGVSMLEWLAAERARVARPA